MPPRAGWGRAKPPPGVPVDRQHPLAQGLTAAYLFNEGGGLPFSALGPGVSAVPSATAPGPQWRGGGYGAAPYFDGTNRYFRLADHPSLNPGYGITVETRYIPNDTASNRRIMQKGESDNQYRLLQEPGAGYQLFWGVAGGNGAADGLTTGDAFQLANGTSYHAAGVLTPGVFSGLYVNGVLRASGGGGFGVGTALGATTDDLYVGTKNASAPNGDSMQGVIEWVRIWERALTPAEVGQLYEQPFDMMWAPAWRRWFIPAAGAAAQDTPELYGRPFGQHGQTQMHQLLAQ